MRVTYRLMVAFAALALGTLALAGCSESAEKGAPAGEPAAQTANMMPRPSGLLPAYRTTWEKSLLGAKADAFRDANPQYFAITETPNMDGFRHMREWEPMQANLIAYSDYLLQDAAIRQTMVDIAVETVEVADLYVVYQSSSARSDLISGMTAAGVSQRTIEANVRFFQMNNDSIWVIDFGPLPLVAPDGSIAFLDWRYYEDRSADDGVPTQLGRELGVTTYRMPFDTEGGNFQGDGDNVCYTTQRAFAYNGSTAAEFETQLRYYANCQELVVLRDIHNDGTGHIDMFFKLVSPTVAIVGSFTNAQDSQAKADMDWNAQLLESRGMTVYRMPMPDAYNDPWYGTIPRTHLNSTFIDGPRGKVNLWPTYTTGEATRAAAEAVWEQAMPDWTHVGIISDEISTASGAIHCVTRTIPVGEYTPWIADGVCTGGTCDAPAGGYTGSCSGDDDCFGPAWLCNTNQCAFQIPDCDSAADCDDGNVCTDDACVENRCAYSPHCGEGTVCVPETGACEVCEPNCGGRQCGDDGCGGTCGTCGNGQTCFVGACVTGCGELPYEGCCDGNTAWWCDGDGNLQSQDCPGEAPICSWTGADYGYYCGTTDGGSTPTLPRACTDYIDLSCSTDADCNDGNECTEDSCVAGTCQNAAIPDCCMPICDGRECGDDGCGGSCGTCAEGELCNASGTCQVDTGDICAEMPFEGCCDGETALWCEGGELQQAACAQNEDPAYQTCGWSAEGGFFDCGGTDTIPDGVTAECPGGSSCTPSCDGRECGSDGCGGSCGTCAADETCNAGVCETGGTGDICDEMPFEGCCDGEIAVWCEGGELQQAACPDNPDASAQTCGWSAENNFFDCGGSDTVPADVSRECPGSGCAVDADCDDNNLCTADACVDGACVRTPVCADGETCDPATGQCSVCTPSCGNRECGDDGCGGSCGECADGSLCFAGACQAGCGDLPWEGCCDDTTAYWCQDGQLGMHTCGADEPYCGWLGPDMGYYCSADPVGTDPSGALPLECSEYTDIAPECTTDDDCAVDTLCVESTCVGGQCQHDDIPGCCTDDSECDDGDATTADACTNNVCTHTPMGDCATAADCDDGDACTTDACNDGVCANAAVQCADGETCDPTSGACVCVPDCSGLSCGDDGCGGSCGTCAAGLECQEGACVCAPSCDGRVCGDDGCGGSCGSCADGLNCHADGQCHEEPCEPSCDGVACGDDGCGGSCGTCAGGESCVQGQCLCIPVCDGLQCGDDGCGGSCGTCADGMSCNDAGLCVEGPCEPACDGLQCGDDGCGGSCGTCADGMSCNDAGQCVEGPCEPACDGLECGDDGCGGVCGTCAAGMSCNDAGLCVEDPCEPSCNGKQCGDDGCGGSCGTCAAGQSCRADGICIDDPCEPVCDGKQCGDDGCGGVCGTCADGEECRADGVCIPGVCEPVCDGKSCGDDGCGGTCGACAEGQVCGGDGICRVDPACVPQCDGKNCGDDGCGGVCGTCADGQSCREDGVCIAGDDPGNIPGGGDGGDEESAGGSGCTTGGSSPAAPALFFVLLLGLAVLRRRASSLQ